MKRDRSPSLATALRAFLTDYLPRQRAMSADTLHSYRDSLKLFLEFTAGKKADPSQLTLEQLTPERVTAFLHPRRQLSHERQAHRVTPDLAALPPP